MTRICSKCQAEKQIEDFELDTRYAGNRKGQCKACVYARKYARNRERTAERRMLREGPPPPDGMKRCSRCREVKSEIQEFLVGRGECRACHATECSRRAIEKRRKVTASQTKRCSACDEVKPVAAFFAKESAPGRCPARCLQCRLEKKTAFHHIRKEGDTLTKQCGSCKTSRPVTAFGKDASANDGLASTCRTCRKDARKKFFAEPGRTEDANAWSNKYRAENPGMRRNEWLKARYGLTADDFNKMFVEQGGRCGICEKHSSEMSKGLVVDHNHSTNVVRELLCYPCNFAIGHFQESAVLMLGGVRYMARHGLCSREELERLLMQMIDELTAKPVALPTPIH